MKITLLADIHGNLPALQAVLRHAEGQLATGTILNLGDSVGYGPNPDEVVKWTRSAQVINILGNYDQKVLSKQHRKAGWARVKNEDKRAMFAWTYQALSKKSRKFLKKMSLQHELVIEGHRILMTHGSPASINEHLHPDTPEAHLKELAAMADAEIILCGHSHQAFLRRVGDVQFINPGTVGRPDDGDPRASYAVLDISEDGVSVEFHRVPYDIASAIRSMRQTRLPEIFSQILAQGLNYNDVLANFGDFPEGLAPLPNGTLTLLTDFGTQDHFTGVMKGVILEMAPQAHIVDITHQISPQDVMQGAHMLTEAIPYFAPGTVHVAVVDPGVGTRRRALAARIGAQYYVVPDNGLLSFVLERAKNQGDTVKIITLDQAQYWLPQISRSFHGRDIFAPVGAHLVNGVPLEKLGSSVDDPVILEPSEPIRTDDGWLGEIISVDTFGNLSSNIKSHHLPLDHPNLKFQIEGETIDGIKPTFGDEPPDTLIATINSSNALAISLVNGNAQERLGARVGSHIRVIFT